MATKWYGLGLQLLDDSGILDTIRSNNPTDVECCCTEIFKKWLEIKPDANWGQLITALNEIGLKAAADCVTTRFTTTQKPGNPKFCIFGDM